VLELSRGHSPTFLISFSCGGDTFLPADHGGARQWVQKSEGDRVHEVHIIPGYVRLRASEAKLTTPPSY